jgi:membrane protein
MIIKESINKFLEDRVLRLSAATAYYAIFSIGPLLVLVVGLAGLAFGEETVRREMTAQVQAFVGPKSARLIDSMMTVQHQGGSLLATIVGGTALVIGAAGAFSQLQDSLNTIWGVTTKPGQGLGAFIRDRVFSMAMVLAIGFLLLVSMALTAFVNAFSQHIERLIALPAWIALVFDALVSFGVTTLLFTLIFKVLPDVKIRWRDVWAEAVGTSLLFTVGKHLLGFYLGYETESSAYGIGSAFVVILLYVYYSSLILYLGAEFTEVYAKHHGAKFLPSKYAVAITNHDRARQGMPRSYQVEEAARRAAQERQDQQTRTE